MGIPTAILLGVVVLSFTPYTINMVTLIGALLIIGMLVDGAVIISENIQRHIVQGDDKFEAAISGTKEVMLPVLASSFTTVFAFLPMMMLTNELGQFLLMIPVAIIVLIIASLVESFIFLPIHSLHFLNKNDKELDWSKAQNFYEKILSKVVAYRKTFLASFMIIIPIVTVLIISNMKFQMFPDFDGNRFFIEGEFDVNQNVKETYEKTKMIEDILLEQKEILGIKNISYTSGYKETDEEAIMKSSIFQFNVELHKKIPDNFVDEYITPFLSFENDDTPSIREYTVNEIIEKLNSILKDYNPKGIKSFVIKKEGSGVTAHDIEILLSTKDKKTLLEAIKKIEDKLLTIDGVYSVENTAQLGIKELKLKLNSYGESLGFNETLLSSNIASLYLEAKHSKGFDQEGIFEILTYSLNKDNFELFENMELNIPNSEQKIALRDICDFTYVQNFDSIKKVNKQDVKMVTANVHTKKITAIEVLEQLKPIFQEYKEQGVIISLEGEQEQNERMKKEMSYAFFIAVFLMFITLLVMFDSFKYTFMILSIIPFSVLGGIIGHLIMGLNLSLTSIIGVLGLAGVVINNAIVMIDFMKNSTTIQEVIESAKLRLRPIIITSVTTFLGLTTLMFYATGQAKILQPIAISLGFGLIWGTVLTLLYIPILFIISKKFTKGETI
jgi:multidrug efflux pump subunit AcrB